MTSPLVWIGVGVLIALFAAGVGFFLMQVDLNAPSPDGSLNQSPFLYLGMLLAILAIGYAFARLFNAHSLHHRFALGMFVNIAVAGLLVGGIIHEMVHVVLLNHATQFSVHFGDGRAVFSTCCLAAGELAHEEIAYAVQFFATLLWILVFRHLFFTSNFPAPSAPKSTAAAAPKPIARSHSDIIEDEWESQKKLMEHYLNPKKTHAHHVSARTREEDELDALDRLKVQK